MNEILMANLKSLPKNYSSWVVFVVSGVAMWWLDLDPAKQAEYLAAWPSIKLLAPFASIVAFLVARAAPQPEKLTEAQWRARLAAEGPLVSGETPKAIPQPAPEPSLPAPKTQADPEEIMRAIETLRAAGLLKPRSPA